MGRIFRIFVGATPRGRPWFGIYAIGVFVEIGQPQGVAPTVVMKWGFIVVRAYKNGK